MIEINEERVYKAEGNESYFKTDDENVVVSTENTGTLLINGGVFTVCGMHWEKDKTYYIYR